MPSVIGRYDLEEVAAAVAPRRLCLVNVVDHAKKPLPVEKALKEYQVACAAYKALGVPEEIRFARADAEELVKAETFLR